MRRAPAIAFDGDERPAMTVAVSTDAARLNWPITVVMVSAGQMPCQSENSSCDRHQAGPRPALGEHLTK